MKSRVTKAFKFAIGGNLVVDVKPGAIVEGRCAEVAIAEKWGEPLEEKPVAPPQPTPTPEGPALVEAEPSEEAVEMQPVEPTPVGAPKAFGKRKGR